MNGKHHRLLLKLALLPAVVLLALFHADIAPSMIFITLWLLAMKVSPDIDLKLPFFKHRGISHSLGAWAAIGTIGVVVIGWPVIGFIIPQFLHIGSDLISTGIKRIVPNWIEKGIEKVF